MPKIRNIIIFVAIVVALFLVYIFLIKPSSSNQASLVSSSDTTATSDTTGSGTDANTLNETSAVAGNFLTLLLSVKTIKLDDSIFSDPAFIGLHDSSIVLVPDSTTGRPNPFAQFGAENIVIPAPTTTTTPNTVPQTTGANVSNNSANTKILPN